MAITAFMVPGTTSAFPCNMAFTAVRATGTGPVPNFRASASMLVMFALAVNPVMMLPGFTQVTLTGPSRSSRRSDRDHRHTTAVLPQ